MTRMLLATLTIIAAALPLMGRGRGGGGGGGGGFGGGSSQTKIYRRSRVAVPKPSMPSHVVSGQGRSAYPERDESGARISKPAATAPPSHHASVVQNTTVVRNIQSQQRGEMTPNHYYWHNEGGMRYSHYYDGHNHWYGFYHGPTFYWTRYYGDRWWWFDGGGARWVFWWDGFWWWPGPGGAAFVYVGGNYYPYESEGVTVEHEETQVPPAAIPAPNPGAASKSPDGRRMVQLTGANGEAFLYDTTTSPPSFVKFLGGNVSKVRYSGGTAGAPLQILVEYKDDTFAMFDADGNSQSSAVQAAEPKLPPLAAPDSIPPMPTSAPGQ
jgi:hypothetical protein